MKKSMPDMKTLHTQAPRLTSRASNGNIREGYATIASPSRRSPGGFGALFGQNLNFGANNSNSPVNNGSGVPPVPSLPASVLTGVGVNGGNGGQGADSPTSGGVVRQPRGPGGGVGGFGTRRERVAVSETLSRGNGGLEARSHEPLEM